MGWIIVGIVAIVAVVLLLRSGNLKFWKAVRNHPIQAMQFFQDNPDVFAIKGVTHEAIDWTYYNAGPFLFPFMGETFHIYANQEKLKSKEDELIHRL